MVAGIMEIDISTSAPFSIKHNRWAHHVLESLQSLRLGTVLCDTTIVTDDGGSFHAHSNLLAACSPVLQSSFPSGGNQEFLVPLHGVSALTCSLLLDFLYTGQINCDGENLMQLVVYADQLEVPGVSEAVADQQNDSGANKTHTGTVKPEVQDAGIQVQVTQEGNSMILEGPDDTSYNIECDQPQWEPIAQPAVTDAIAAILQTHESPEQVTDKESQDAPTGQAAPSEQPTPSGQPIKEEPLVETDNVDDICEQSAEESNDTAVAQSPPSSSLLSTPQSVRRSSRAMKKSQVFSEYENRSKRMSTRNTFIAPTKDDNQNESKGEQKIEDAKDRKAKAVKVEKVKTDKEDAAKNLTPQETPMEKQDLMFVKKTQRKSKQAKKDPIAIIQVKQEPADENIAPKDDVTAPGEKSLDLVNDKEGDTISASAIVKSRPLKRKRKGKGKKGTKLANEWSFFQHGEEAVEMPASGDELKKDAESKLIRKKPRAKRVKKEKQNLPCEICGKTFPCVSARTIHEMRHKQIRPWQCDLCTKTFITKSSLAIHRRIHTGEKPHICQFCGQKFGDPSAWRAHERKHADTIQWPCTLCSQVYETKRVLVKHQKTQHGTVDAPLKCPHCNKGFMKDFELRIHERMHKNGFVCKICEKIFPRRSGYEIHMRLHTGEKPFHCQYCALAYASEVSLRSHEKKHIEGQQFQCQFCARKFYRKWECDIHERTHTGVRPYSCDYCRATFKGISHLRVHERSHTGIKPYLCRTCPSKFTSSSALKRHEATHTTERPYTCDECGKMFRRASHLKSHLRTHAGIEELSREAAKAHIQQISAEVENAGIVSIVPEAESVQEVDTVPAVGDVQEIHQVGDVQEIHEISMEDLNGEITVEEVQDADSSIYIQILNM